MEESPTQVGPYKILDVLGEGGMGTVYEAEQKVPVRRLVALKVIKLGMDSKEVVARFELERRALAAMSHSSIAKVYEVGTTERGQPYFVMELVQGMPLTDYCDKHRLSLEERVDLFQQVCAGVQHAHQKGVIHRDLKPGNILVVREGDKAVPKIVDFGLAKATNRDLLAQTIHTEREQILGTPEYMAPEQAAFDHEAVDARADIYSLGVILYELMAGELPFPSHELREAGWLEIQRKLREDEPPKPSTRLTSVGDRASEWALKRRTSPKALTRELRGDLDWIVLRALAKEPERRYDSATGLAADLQRYLDHDPVTAGPPSASYRLRKLVRRYRGQVVAGAVVLIVLLAGIVGTTLGLLRASENLDQFNLLANVVNLRRTKLAETDLYPAWPEKIEAMDRWLREQAEPLAETSPKLRATRDMLRDKALAWSEAEQQQDRATHPDLPEVEQQRQQIEELRAERAKQANDDPDASGKRAELDQRIAKAEGNISTLEQIVKERRTWTLEARPDQFLHDTLTRLVLDLEAFTAEDGPLAKVKERRAWAEKVEALSIDAHRARWNEARAALAKADDIVASELYRAQPIELNPQMGLVPIGMNPVTRLWEFYHMRSAADPSQIPAHDTDGSIEVDGDTGIVFVLLPGRTLAMGAQKEDPEQPNYDPQAESDESPVHEVTLVPYFLARHELTQGQWARLWSGEEGLRQPSYYTAEDTHGGAPQITLANPVEQVDSTMCSTLLTRHELALPSEAQWEYACRAGTTSPWVCDLGELQQYANLADATSEPQANWDCEAWTDGHVVHAAVGSFEPNRFGFHDMYGNVWEWCLDEYGSYSRPARPGDGLRLQGEGSSYRVYRGGSFRSPAVRARSGNRDFHAPTVRVIHLGLRPARSLLP